MESTRYLVKTHLITDIGFYKSNRQDIPFFVCNVSFLIPPDNLKAISELLYFLTFEDKPAEFCLTIHLEGALNAGVNEKWMSFFITLLADINYSKFRGNHIVFIDSVANMTETYQWVKNLSDQLRSLGFKKIIFHDIRETECEDFRLFNIDFLQNIDSAERLLSESIKELHFYFFSKVIIHESKKIENFINAVSSLEERTTNMAIQINNLNALLANQNEYVAYLEESLKSKTEYLSFLLRPVQENSNDHSSTEVLSDIQKMKNFYHYEYEILPLWFKRLGHIIKVIMGKRSFRSLFDENVKKYRD